MAAGQVVVWLMGGFLGKSADTNVTEDHELPSRSRASKGELELVKEAE
jgi:hypothetical protein